MVQSILKLGNKSSTLGFLFYKLCHAHTKDFGLEKVEIETPELSERLKN